MKIALLLEGMDGNNEWVEFTLKNVRAMKSSPTLKAPIVVIPGNAANDGKTVIGAFNILSTCKDRSKHVRNVLFVKEVQMDSRTVEAYTDKDDKSKITITKLEKKSGNIKATVIYDGGFQKNVSIKVSLGK